MISRILLSVCLILSSHLTIGQTKPRVNIVDVFAEAQKPGDEMIIVENKTVYFPEPGQYDTTLLKLQRPIAFRYCDFDYSSYSIIIDAPYFEITGLTKAARLFFMRCRIDTLELSSIKGNTTVAIHESRIGQTHIEFNSEFEAIGFYNSKFSSTVWAEQLYGKSPGNLSLNLEGSTFLGPVSFSGEFSTVNMRRNTFTSSVGLDDVNISNWTIIEDNKIDGAFEVSALTFVIPENVKFNFAQLQGGKLTSITKERVDMEEYFMLAHKTNAARYYSEDPFDPEPPYTDLNIRAAAGDSLYYHQAGFADLLYNYQRFYNIYKLRGDLASTNASYVEMKDIQTEYFGFQYRQDPSFNAFFRWRLAQMMKVYTQHGTDPAKAMTISFYIIVLFGIFYIFFPSDWDVASKSKIVSDFRQFVEKNEHGYFRPFLRMVSGLAVSFINALTLSLNSFTTLGFGNIPTHGLARYVCIVQGFIGWFLLSIFTVALINQVLT
jgi:hypothetical protein